MKKERKELQLSLLELNTGQIDWLPANPRQWTREDLDKTTESIKRDPDFLEDRPILVLPIVNGRYCVFAGNLRSSGCVQAKRKTAPCIIYQVENDEDKATVKRRAILDNGSFGSWDYDQLANEWDDLPLDDWGVKTPKKNEKTDDELREEFSQAAGTIVYEPSNEKHRISDLYSETSRFADIIDKVQNDEMRKMLRVRQSWFADFNYAKIADYYANQATVEEQEAFEALGLILLDKDGLIRNGFCEIAQTLLDETKDDGVEID